MISQSNFDALIPTPPTPSDNHLFGTVVSANPSMVRIDGDTQPTPVTSLVPLAIGARVLLVSKGLQRIVLGTISPVGVRSVPQIFSSGFEERRVGGGATSVLAETVFRTVSRAQVEVCGNSHIASDGNCAGTMRIILDGAPVMDVFRAHSFGTAMRDSVAWCRRVDVDTPSQHTLQITFTTDPAGGAIDHRWFRHQAVVTEYQ